MTNYRCRESRTFEALWIFALEDGYLKRLRGPASHPRPFEPLLFELVGQEVGGVMRDLPQPREMAMTVNASGYHLFLGKERLADDSLRVFDLAPGNYRVRIRGPYYKHLALDMPLPMSGPQSVALQPAGTYPFPPARRYNPDDDPGPCGAAVSVTAGDTRLRGELLQPNGRGFAGAKVEIAGVSNTYIVGENGQWVLWFEPGDSTITGLHQVDFTLPDSSTFSVTAVCIVKGCETSLRSTALRGHVLRNGVGVGKVQIAVSGFPDVVRSRANGSWWYYFLPDQADQNVTVTATLPDGQNDSAAVQIIHGSTVRVPTFNFP